MAQAPNASRRKWQACSEIAGWLARERNATSASTIVETVTNVTITERGISRNQAAPYRRASAIRRLKLSNSSRAAKHRLIIIIGASDGAENWAL